MQHVKKRVPKFPLRTETELLGDLPERIGVDARRCRAIMADYFAMAWEAVLAGSRWYFPGGNSLYIGYEDAPGIYFKKYKPDGTIVPAYNSRRLNKEYGVFFCGPLITDRHMVFYKPRKYGSRLFEILIKTDIEFRYKEDEH